MKYALDAVWYMFPGLFASGFASQSLPLTWGTVLVDFGIFCLFLPRASREVKISRKCLTCLPKQRSSATENNRHSFNAKQRRFNAKTKFEKIGKTKGGTLGN